MLLAYVDESYDDERHWIAAVVVPENEVQPLIEGLDDVVRTASRAYGVDQRAELHGHDLFQAKEDWAGLSHMPRARIAVYNAAFEAIGNSDVEIIIRGVHVQRLNERYTSPDHPHAVVLQHLLERIDECAQDRHSAEPVLVIADEVDQADQHRRSLWRFQRYATTGYRARRLRHIVDTIHFAPSSASRLVQAADLVVFLHRRIEARSRQGCDGPADRANRALWKRIEDRVLHQHCWWP